MSFPWARGSPRSLVVVKVRRGAFPVRSLSQVHKRAIGLPRGPRVRGSLSGPAVQLHNDSQLPERTQREPGAGQSAPLMRQWLRLLRVRPALPACCLALFYNLGLYRRSARQTVSLKGGDKGRSWVAVGLCLHSSRASVPAQDWQAESQPASRVVPFDFGPLATLAPC